MMVKVVSTRPHHHNHLSSSHQSSLMSNLCHLSSSLHESQLSTNSATYTVIKSTNWTRAFSHIDELNEELKRDQDIELDNPSSQITLLHIAGYLHPQEILQARPSSSTNRVSTQGKPVILAETLISTSGSRWESSVFQLLSSGRNSSVIQTVKTKTKTVCLSKLISQD